MGLLYFRHSSVLLVNFVAGSTTVYFFLGLPEYHNSLCLWVTAVDSSVQELQSWEYVRD